MVSNAVGVATSATCRVAQSVQILSQTLPGGMELAPYYAELTGTNGFPPYTWIMSNGVPPGLSLSGTGIISGLPTLAGTYAITFIIRDSAGHSAEREVAITIAPNPNQHPVFAYSTPSAGTFTMNEGTSQTFRALAYDPEWGDILYSWTWDGNLVGASSGLYAQYTHSTQWGDAGPHVLRCYASDDLWSNVVYIEWNVMVRDDNDSDGMPNGQEMDLGRNPNDPNDGGLPSSLFGAIRGGGIGLSNAYVELRGLSGRTYYRGTADGAGGYSIDTIQPGRYYVKVGAERFADEWYNNATHRTSAAPYSIPAESRIGGFNFDLKSGQNPAFVEVTSDPAGAVVYLDYQPTTNVTPAVLNVGEVGDWDWAGYRMASHVITVKKAGRPRPSPQSVAAKEAETVSAHFDLTTKAWGSASIATAPDGATVFVGYADSSDGITPVIVGNLAPGSHVVLLKKTGYLQPRPVMVWIQDGLTNEVLT